MIYLAEAAFETKEGRFAIVSKDDGDGWFLAYGGDALDSLEIDVDQYGPFAEVVLAIYLHLTKPQAPVERTATAAATPG